MHKNKFIMTLLAAGLIGFGGSAHAFGLGLLAAGVASYFGWGESAEASGDAAEGEGQKSGGMGMGGMVLGFMKGDTKGAGDAATRADQRLVRIKSDLNPTAEQEVLWNDFAEKTRLEAEAGKRVREVRGKAREEKLAGAAYRERNQAALQDQLAAYAAATDSFHLLYAALTPEQKLVADRHMVGSAAKISGEPPVEPPAAQSQSSGQPLADMSATPVDAGGG